MLLILLILCGVFAIILLSKHQSYFKSQNVPYIKSIPLLGVLSDVVFRKKGIYESICDIYNHPKFKHEPFYGIFLFHKPTLFIKDPELIKRVLVKDFSSFSNRYSSTSDDDLIGAPNMFVVKNPQWKHIRSKFSSFFSSGKLKAAYYIIEEMGNRLVKYVEKRSNNGVAEINLKTAVTLYTIDIIGNMAFGLDPQGLLDVCEEFHKSTMTIYGKNFMRSLEISTILLLPVFMKVFNAKLLGSRATKFILKWMPQVISDREKSGVKRNDLIDMIVEMRAKNEFSDNVMFAQAGSFLGAGYETSSSTASFALYELCKNQEIQQRLRDEIKDSLMKHDGKIPYETIAMPSEMPYLHQIVNETLRMYAIIPFLDRVCEEKDGYSLQPFSDFKIPYGMPVLIPIYPLGYDEKYFTEPWKFNPDRFEDTSSIPSCAHIPFGTGPRSCIGERLGLIEVKMAIVKILREFRVEMNEKTPREVKLKKEAIVIAPDKPLIVDFVKDTLEI